MKKKLSIAATAFILPFMMASCGGETCRECSCDIEESVTVTNLSSGDSETNTETKSRTFTACDSEVNNHAVASWEYWDANPTIVTERTESHPQQGDRKIETTEEHTCNCEED